jgi:hypothetical protein
VHNHSRILDVNAGARFYCCEHPGYADPEKNQAEMGLTQDQVLRQYKPAKQLQLEEAPEASERHVLRKFGLIPSPDQENTACKQNSPSRRQVSPS